jgi:hypothetical protein
MNKIQVDLVICDGRNKEIRLTYTKLLIKRLRMIEEYVPEKMFDF